MQRLAAYALPSHLPLPLRACQDIVSELPERFFVAEIIRKHVFLQYRQEVPYGVTGGHASWAGCTNKVMVAAIAHGIALRAGGSSSITLEPLF